METEPHQTRSGQASAPARVCLAGEDLDWLGGASIQAAINLRVDYRCDWASRPAPFEISASGAFIGATRAIDAWSLPTFSWAKLPAICATYGCDRADGEWPYRITIKSDVPAGAGLASSAALCVAGLAACAPGIGAQDLMRLGWQAEYRLAARTVGPMDYAPCAVGGVSRVSCSESGVDTLELLNWPRAARLLVINTGIARNTSDVITWKRARQAAADAGVARYVAKTRALVTQLGQILSSAEPDIVDLGNSITAAHATLRDDMRVSNFALESCVSSLLRIGAVGAKITGSGMGGCVFGVFHELDAERAFREVARQGMWAQLVHVSMTGAEGHRDHFRGVDGVM
ncbi:mevalonate kinase [Amycolatopsis sp. NPDC049252]|uniref:mevalonate kinase family protein n=1 Tax=Amycolatopsis sp. NPDC049252 TaxID=3363933 RepID=UPI003720BEFF